MAAAVLILSALVLAFANGANDNFKGVATLFGSGTTNYRRALMWATVTTLFGSLAAVFLAGKLLKNFSGKGLVNDGLIGDANYAAAVAMGAGLTVLLATRVGIPISTTHSLVGALVGAGLAAGSPIDVAQLGGTFFLPLLVSPMLAIAATCFVYPLFRVARNAFGVTAETCICIGSNVVEVVPSASSAVAMERVREISVQVGEAATCRSRYEGRVMGIEAGTALDRMHYGSAGMVGFARGLNDTPKMAAMLLLIPQLGDAAVTALVGVTIAVGGVLSARRVAETMSQRITRMNHGQGFTANLVTAVIVIGASRFGMPVSTTHVSCGALFGIGTITRQARWGTIGTILGAWLITLPLGAVLGATSFAALRVL